MLEAYGIAYVSTKCRKVWGGRVWCISDPKTIQRTHSSNKNTPTCLFNTQWLPTLKGIISRHDWRRSRHAHSWCFGCSVGWLPIDWTGDRWEQNCNCCTFCLDESIPTTTLLPPVPQSTRLLRRNHTTLTKYNIVSSITILCCHCQIRHGDINKIILQLLGDLLTPHLQRMLTKATSDAHHRLVVLSSSSQTTKKIAPAPQFSGVHNYNNKNNNTTGHKKWKPFHKSQKPSNPNEYPLNFWLSNSYVSLNLQPNNHETNNSNHNNHHSLCHRCLPGLLLHCFLLYSPVSFMNHAFPCYLF